MSTLIWYAQYIFLSFSSAMLRARLIAVYVLPSPLKELVTMIRLALSTTVAPFFATLFKSGRLITLKEWDKGVSADTPKRSHHLFEINQDELMNYSVKSKKFWLQSVEAALRYSFIAPEDDEKSVYEPSRKSLRQWIETNRY